MDTTIIAIIIESIERDIEEMSQPIDYHKANQFYAGAVMYAEYILSVLQNLNLAK